jgi:hypothetical protein
VQVGLCAYDPQVMDPGPTSTYRYTADGQLAAVVNREAAARLRKPRLLVSFVVVGLVLGICASFTANAASLPDYLGRVLLIGVLWGLGWVVLVLVLMGAVGWPLAKVLNRRMMKRLFPQGSVTEVVLGPDMFVIKRPMQTRSIPYRTLFRLRPVGSFMRVELRRRLMAELLPLEMLPDHAIDFVRAKAQGRAPVAAPGGGNQPTRRVVVPDGWAAHVAAVHTWAVLRRTEFWVRLGLVLLASALLAVVTSTWWLLAAPSMALVNVTATYVWTRRAIALAVPPQSVASTEFFEDRFISRNRGGAREVRFDEIRTVDVRGDVALLRLVSERQTLAIARALLPEHELERLDR